MSRSLFYGSNVIFLLDLPIDTSFVEPVQINFSTGSLTVLNICLAFIMLGVALGIKPGHFSHLINQKKALLTGLLSQIVLLPLLTVLLVLALPIEHGMALGMILVAACPGGNVSNFFTMLAKGNVALSVTLTAFSSLFAFVITPLNFFFWASLVPGLSLEIKELHIDFWSLTFNMALILLLPLVTGMILSRNFPSVNQRLGKPIRALSMIILAGFIVIAFLKNQQAFTAYFTKVFWIVLLHNGLALLGSYFFSASLKNDESVNKTVAIETGIQNSGLGLILIFTFFKGDASMAIVAAWWGVWHLVSGFGFSLFMRNKNIVLPVR